MTPPVESGSSELRKPDLSRVVKEVTDLQAKMTAWSASPDATNAVTPEEIDAAVAAQDRSLDEIVRNFIAEVHKRYPDENSRERGDANAQLVSPLIEEKNTKIRNLRSALETQLAQLNAEEVAAKAEVLRRVVERVEAAAAPQEIPAAENPPEQSGEVLTGQERMDHLLEHISQENVWTSADLLGLKKTEGESTPSGNGLQEKGFYLKRGYDIYFKLVHTWPEGGKTEVTSLGLWDSAEKKFIPTTFDFGMQNMIYQIGNTWDMVEGGEDGVQYMRYDGDFFSKDATGKVLRYNSVSNVFEAFEYFDTSEEKFYQPWLVETPAEESSESQTVGVLALVEYVKKDLSGEWIQPGNIPLAKNVVDQNFMYRAVNNIVFRQDDKVVEQLDLKSGQWVGWDLNAFAQFMSLHRGETPWNEWTAGRAGKIAYMLSGGKLYRKWLDTAVEPNVTLVQVYDPASHEWPTVLDGEKAKNTILDSISQDNIWFRGSNMDFIRHGMEFYAREKIGNTGHYNYYKVPLKDRRLSESKDDYEKTAVYPFDDDPEELDSVDLLAENQADIAQILVNGRWYIAKISEKSKGAGLNLLDSNSLNRFLESLNSGSPVDYNVFVAYANAFHAFRTDRPADEPTGGDPCLNDCIYRLKGNLRGVKQFYEKYIKPLAEEAAEPVAVGADDGAATGTLAAPVQEGKDNAATSIDATDDDLEFSSLGRYEIFSRGLDAAQRILKKMSSAGEVILDKDVPVKEALRHFSSLKNFLPGEDVSEDVRQLKILLLFEKNLDQIIASDHVEAAESPEAIEKERLRLLGVTLDDDGTVHFDDKEVERHTTIGDIYPDAEAVTVDTGDENPVFAVKFESEFYDINVDRVKVWEGYKVVVVRNGERPDDVAAIRARFSDGTRPLDDVSSAFTEKTVETARKAREYADALKTVVDSPYPPAEKARELVARVRVEHERAHRRARTPGVSADDPKVLDALADADTALQEVVTIEESDAYKNLPAAESDGADESGEELARARRGEKSPKVSDKPVVAEKVADGKLPTEAEIAELTPAARAERIVQMTASADDIIQKIYDIDSRLDLDSPTVDHDIQTLSNLNADLYRLRTIVTRMNVQSKIDSADLTPLLSKINIGIDFIRNMLDLRQVKPQDADEKNVALTPDEIAREYAHLQEAFPQALEQFKDAMEKIPDLESRDDILITYGEAMRGVRDVEREIRTFLKQSGQQEISLEFSRSATRFHSVEPLRADQKWFDYAFGADEGVEKFRQIHDAIILGKIFQGAYGDYVRELEADGGALGFIRLNALRDVSQLDASGENSALDQFEKGITDSVIVLRMASINLGGLRFDSFAPGANLLREIRRHIAIGEGLLAKIKERKEKEANSSVEAVAPTPEPAAEPAPATPDSAPKSEPKPVEGGLSVPMIQ